MRSLLLVGIALLTSLFTAFADTRSPTLKCGAVLPLTGPLAGIGQPIKNSILMAGQDLDPAQSVQFIFEDDQFIPKNTVAAVNKLIGVNKVSCLVVFGSTTSLSVVDIAERAKVPTFSIAISPKVSQGRKYVFRYYVPAARQRDAMIAEIKRRKYSTVAVVSTTQDATLALRDLFLAAAAAEVVLDRELSPDDRDLRTLAIQLKNLGADAVFLNLLPPQFSILGKQLREIGYTGELFSGPPLANPAEIKAAAGSLNGAWFVSIDGGLANNYFKKYQEQYKEFPPFEVVYGYDVAKIIIAGANSGDFYEYLSKLDVFEGLLGKYAFVENTIDLPSGVWRISGTDFEYVAG